VRAHSKRLQISPSARSQSSSPSSSLATRARPPPPSSTASFRFRSATPPGVYKATFGIFFVCRDGFADGALGARLAGQSIVVLEHRPITLPASPQARAGGKCRRTSVRSSDFCQRLNVERRVFGERPNPSNPLTLRLKESDNVALGNAFALGRSREGRLHSIPSPSPKLFLPFPICRTQGRKLKLGQRSFFLLSRCCRMQRRRRFRCPGPREPL